MNALPLLCPVCRQTLQLHVASNGFYCDNQHKIDPNENGIYSLLLSKKHKLQSVSRQQMRTKQFLFASGLFEPLVGALRQIFSELDCGSKTIQHLDYHCADGFFMRSMIGDSVKPNWLHWGVSDAENALFAAAKQNTPGRLILSSMKTLPFKSASMDVVTVLDAPLKGKECLRVLKDDGSLIVVVPDTKHLWELKQAVYPDLVEKPLQLNLPKGVEIAKELSVQARQKVSAQQAQDLVSLASFGWRVDKSVNHDLLQQGSTEVQFAWKILQLKKQVNDQSA